jgi:ferredoxin
MAINRKIIEIDEEKCNGCGQCIVTCAEGAMEIIDGKAKLVADKYCDGLGACLGECPTGALQVIERPADDFDEEAVERRLEEIREQEQPQTMACGCPSSQIQTFEQAPQQTACGCPSANMQTFGATRKTEKVEMGSALSHWPVQIRLVPPNASFLKNADLLVAADCTPVAYPNFHQDFLEGKVVMLGCPKFDDAQMYIDKFAQIFSQASIKSVTVVVMEVPCCQGLPMIVKRGLELAGKDIPLEGIVISTRGEVIRKQKLVA